MPPMMQDRRGGVSSGRSNPLMYFPSRVNFCTRALFKSVTYTSSFRSIARLIGEWNSPGWSPLPPQASTNFGASWAAASSGRTPAIMTAARSVQNAFLQAFTFSSRLIGAETSHHICPDGRSPNSNQAAGRAVDRVYTQELMTVDGSRSARSEGFQGDGRFVVLPRDAGQHLAAAA